jgi:predicted GIY-YIG superfamily endonuclease
MKNAASFLINQYEFSEQGRANVLSSKRGKDWPVVYLIHNDKELYIGETQNAYNRFEQHLQNPKRKNLKEIRIIFDEEFNKSAVLDIEQSLIQLCVADGKYKLQNMNGGQSAKHNYYQREKYGNKGSQIWKELIKKNMATHDYEELKNSDIFKYSPYNTLTPEQDEVSKNVIYDIIDKMTKEEDGTYVINGGAGTGKTIVLINIINKLLTYSKIDFDETRENDEMSESVQLIHDYKKSLRGLARE